MRLVLVCVGLLFLLGAPSYAQNSAQQTSKDNLAAPSPTTVSNSNTSVGVASAATQAQDQTAEPSSGKDTDSGKDTNKESSEHHTHVRLGGIRVSAGYTHFSPFPYIFYNDPLYYRFTGATWWPLWGFYPPFPAGYFREEDGKGKLELNGVSKNALVYVNGGYAGTADHLKSFWLDPGVYDLEVSVPGGHRYQQRVYVLSGKTLHIDAKSRLLTKKKAGEQL